LGRWSAEHGLPNNLAYYVDGTAEQVRRRQLVLNVNRPLEAKDALTILVRYAGELTLKALGQPLPATAKEIIQRGRMDPITKQVEVHCR
jgi:hypothetical protein